MATFQELARDYAERIRKNIELDRFSGYYKIPVESIRNSRTLQEAKAIKREIDQLVYINSNLPLSESDKDAIKGLIDRELGLPQNLLKSYAIESASNDDLADLADAIENVLRGGK